MAAVTREMILEYMQKKGGRVKNVDLVKHFRKHLLYEDKRKKEQARESFKETVNSIAVIRQEEGEKFLYLKEENQVNSSKELHSPSPSHTSQLHPPSPSRVTQPHPTSPSRVTQPHPTSPSRVTQPHPTSPSRVSQPHPPSSHVSQPHPSYSHVSQPYTPSPSQPYPSSHVSQPHPSRAPPSHMTSPLRISQTQHSSSSRPTNLSNGRVITAAHSHVIPTSLQNGGYSDISQPEHKTVTPRHRPVGVEYISKYSTNQISGPVTTTISPPRPTRPVSTGVTSLLQPTTTPTNYYNRYSQATPTSLTTTQNHKNPPTVGPRPPPRVPNGGRKGLDISPPVTNGSTVTESFSSSFGDNSLLQHFTAELENFGTTGLFSDHSYLSTNGTSSHGTSLLGFDTDLPHISPQTTVPTSQPVLSSENSSLSSIHSTSSPPPVDVTPVVTITKTNSKGSQFNDVEVGVQQLIKQYTPGSVVPSHNNDNNDMRGSSSPRRNRMPRSSSSASNHSGGSGNYLGLRREPTPPDSRVQRSHSNAGTQIRRSLAVNARNSNLDTLTRQSIKGTPRNLSHRLSRNSDELFTNSKEELLSIEDPDRDSPLDERYENYIIEIDALEKEWMHALIDGNIDAIHRMIMADTSYINRKGFLYGWTALHWAVKLGREDIIAALVFSGAKVDIKSNGGLTPLHIAAECGLERIIRSLVYEYNASVNIRDHSGRRPIDLLPRSASESMRGSLRNGLTPLPGFRNASLAIAMGAPINSFHISRSGGTQSATTLKRQWNSTGHIDKDVTEKGNKKQVSSPRSVKKGFSFRKKKYQVNGKEKRNSYYSENYEKYES